MPPESSSTQPTGEKESLLLLPDFPAPDPIPAPIPTSSSSQTIPAPPVSPVPPALSASSPLPPPIPAVPLPAAPVSAASTSFLPPHIRPHRHRQILAFAACMLLLIIFVGAERFYQYAWEKTSVYSTAPAASLESQPMPVTNEILPLTNGSQPGSSAPSVNSTTSAISATPVTPAVPAKPAAPVNPLSTVTSWAYLVGNATTGQVYLSHDASEVLPIASISKLTTALVARQFMDQSQLVPITPQVMAVYSDAYGLYPGENFTVSELYYPMLLQSNDNAAAAFAFAYGAVNSGTSTNTAFVQKMNDYVGELGMTHSHFLDSTGLNDGNVSTASDLFTMAQFLYADKFTDKLLTPNIFSITTLPSESVGTTTEHGSHDFVNINPFVGNPAFVGGKTGRTDAAGETMLSIFNYQSHGQTDPIVVIVLHSDYGTRQQDTEKLLDVVEQGIAAGKY